MSNFSMKIASVVSMTTLVATTMSTTLVSAASEFLPYAELLADNSVISVQSTESGYRLNDTITRAELAKVVANLGGYTPTSCAGTVYGDVKSTLGDLCGYVEALAEAGIVSTSNANFRPSAPVTRAEMTKMVVGALGETPSDVSAGYMDVTASLGDLAGYINRANELGCAKDATYYRVNASTTRGETFKVASCVAQLEPTTPVVTPGTGSTSTGVVSTGTTSTGVVVAGALTVAIDGTAVAQYVPMNASSVKVGSVKVTAGTSDVTVNSFTVNRSGLGDSTNLSIAIGQSGTIISEARSVNTATQDAIVRLNNPTTIKAGTTVSFEVLVSVNGSANSQHQFTVKSVGTTAAVTGTPVVLGLLNTTSYGVTEVTVGTIKMNSVTSGKNDQSLGTVELRAGTKDITLNGFTLTKASGVDLTKALANVSVYKNSVKVGTATVTSDKIYVSALATKVARNDTATFELRGDVTYVGANALGVDNIRLNITDTTDVSGTEDLTGYAVAIKTPLPVASASNDIVLSSLDIVWTKNTTKSVTIAPGTSNVVLFDAKLASSASFDVTEFKLIPVGAATPLTDVAETSAYNSLTLTVNGVDYDLLSTNLTAGTGTYTFNKTSDKFRIDAGTPVNVRLTANLSNTAGTGTYSYKTAITKVKNVSTGNEVALDKDVTGDNVTVSAPSLTVKASSVAAPSATKIYSNAASLEIGRFGLEAKAEEVTVREITLTNSGNVAGSFTGVADLSKLVSGTNVKLVNVGDKTQVSATVTMSGTTAIKLTGMSIKVAKDTTSNFKVLVDTQGDLVTTASGSIALKVALVSASASSNATIATSTYQTTKVYSVSVIPPTVEFVKKDANTFLMKITNVDGDSDITLTSVSAQVRPVSVANSSYDAYACIRDEGSADKCGLAAVANAVQKVPGAGVTFTITKDVSGSTFPVVISKNSSITRELYVDSSFVNPSDLQAEITALNYGVSETYSVVAK